MLPLPHARLLIRVRTFGPILVLAALAVLATAAPIHRAAQAATAITGLHVQGNRILNGSNQAIRLLGVDRSGTEYACIQGWGIFDGPNDAASVQAIGSWHVNVVRVPLNEDCWLDINMGSSTHGGSTYRQAIVSYVNLLNAHGIVAILDLHWNAPGTSQATGQQPMPDEDHAPAFWQSVATTFKGNSSVIFDLYNEPYPDNNRDTTAGWRCWRDGGTCPGVSFRAAGMQQLVTTIRDTGASNVIMLGGLQYANALSHWLTYEPSDPRKNLAASWHSYNFNLCSTASCWASTVAPVARQVPVIAGEIGENDCAHGYIDPLMRWLDRHNASYLGWTWDTWDCKSGPALISDYDGAPTGFGMGLRRHLAALTTSTPAGFALTVSPKSRSVSSTGGTRTYTVAITASPGFHGRVSLSARGQPPSSTIGFTPNPATSRSRLTVTVARRTPRGTYTIRIRGTSGALKHTVSVRLIVTKP